MSVYAQNRSFTIMCGAVLALLSAAKGRLVFGRPTPEPSGMMDMWTTDGQKLFGAAFPGGTIDSVAQHGGQRESGPGHRIFNME